MDFLEVKVFCEDSFKEILIAEFGELGFDSMIEFDEGFNTYHKDSKFDLALVQELISRYGSVTEFNIDTRLVAKQNWNQEWENNYEPVTIGNDLSIRASFHAPLNTKLELIIDPKMSFGTGHHETTFLMAKQMLTIDIQDKKVLDVGCGTGVLSILAKKMGAHVVHGIDIDEWAVESSIENSQKNNVVDIAYWSGDVHSVRDKDYDLILANINKNVLLQDIPHYVRLLESNGKILLSGFYSSDLLDVEAQFSPFGASSLVKNVLEDWICILFDFS